MSKKFTELRFEYVDGGWFLILILGNLYVLLSLIFVVFVPDNTLILNTKFSSYDLSKIYFSELSSTIQFNIH